MDGPETGKRTLEKLLGAEVHLIGMTVGEFKWALFWGLLTGLGLAVCEVRWCNSAASRGVSGEECGNSGVASGPWGAVLSARWSAWRDALTVGSAAVDSRAAISGGMAKKCRVPVSERPARIEQSGEKARLDITVGKEPRLNSHSGAE